MNSEKKEHPPCYGELTTVFPLHEDGLRETPPACFRCRHKTPCLRSAMAGIDGLKVRQEFVDRAYSSGRITFWERWSRKKTIARCKKDKAGAKDARS